MGNSFQENVIARKISKLKSNEKDKTDKITSFSDEDKILDFMSTCKDDVKNDT